MYYDSLILNSYFLVCRCPYSFIFDLRDKVLATFHFEAQITRIKSTEKIMKITIFSHPFLFSPLFLVNFNFNLKIKLKIFDYLY